MASFFFLDLTSFKIILSIKSKSAVPLELTWAAERGEQEGHFAPGPRGLRAS